MDRPDFPNIIRRLEQRGLTQRQIARKVGTSQSQICKIKNDRQIPNYYLGNSLIFISNIDSD